MRKAVVESFENFFRHFWKDAVNQYISKSLFKGRRKRHILNSIEKANLVEAWDKAKDVPIMQKYADWVCSWAHTTSQGVYRSENRSNLLIVISGSEELNRSFMKTLMNDLRYKCVQTLPLLVTIDFHEDPFVTFAEFAELFDEKLTKSIAKFYETNSYDKWADLEDVLSYRYDKEFFCYAARTVCSLWQSSSPSALFYFNYPDLLLKNIKASLGDSKTIKEALACIKSIYCAQGSESADDRDAYRFALLFLRHVMSVIQLENTTQQLSDLHQIEYIDMLFDMLNLFNGTSAIPSRAFGQNEAFFGGDETEFKCRHNVCLVLREIKRRSRPTCTRPT